MELLEKLMKEVEKLKLTRESVLHRIEAADKIQPDAFKWLKEVDEIVAMADSFSVQVHAARIKNSSKSFPNLRLRCQFGRKSKQLSSRIVLLQKQGRFDQVSHRASISQQVASPTTSDKDYPSRVSIMEGILECLDDPNLSMIGAYGLPGVGKTTLVQQIAMKAKQNNLFDVVIWVNVGMNPDLRSIQQKIADSLARKFEEESVSERAGNGLMKERSVLIILDDLWEKLDLQEVGIPVPNQKERFKLLMTSRSREVLSHEMGTQKCFLVTTLPEIEAWNLFKEKAELEFDAIPELLSKAPKVAAECAGLPIAIVNIAKDQAQWDHDVTGMQDAIVEEFRRSVERLGKTTESIFCHCGLIMGDNLARSDLLKHSVGLGFFEDIDKMEDVRNRFDACISKLEDLQLLQESNCREFLTMNGFVRNVAISLASKHHRHFMIRLKEGEEWPDGDKLENCTTIILSHHVIDKHPELLNCQKLNFFQLLKTDSSSKLPEKFFKGVRGLKVLNLKDNFFKGMLGLKVLDLTAVKFIPRLPSSILHLEKLTTLCLDYCDLKHMEAIGKLKNLKVLSLSNSSIEELPLELGQLTQLQFLDLSCCLQLRKIPSNVFSSLTKLEELYMLGSFDDWDVNDLKKQQQRNASIFELMNLSSLTTLEVVIPNGRMLPGTEDINRFFGSLKRGKVLLGRQLEFHQFFEHETSAALKLWLSSALTENMESLLACVDHLGIGNLEGANNIVPQLNKAGFPKLKYLCVVHNEMQFIAYPSSNVFPNLESLVLHSLRNLEKLCGGPLMRQSFSRLKFIIMKNCNKLKSLFSFFLVRGFPHLLEVDLESCYIMEGIVSVEGNAAISMLQFPELRNLYLKDLPELVGFRYVETTGNNNLDTSVSLFSDKVELPNLEILEIKWTKNLKKIWECHPLLSLCFGKLKKIDIRYCVGLISVLPYQIITTIPCLETLTVAHCESLQEIVMAEVSPLPFFSEKVDDDGEEIVFAKLKYLELDDLSSLGSFCSVPSTLKFPSLDKLIISKCPRMKIFCRGRSVAPKLKSVTKDGKMHREVDLNTTIQ